MQIPIYKNIAEHRSFVLCLAFALAVSLVTAPAIAQTSLGTSSIGGVVDDPSHLPVPQATVRLLDTQHGTSRKTVTNSHGEYLFPGLQPGFYSVTAGHHGFKSTSVKNTQLIIDQHATINIVLQVGAVTQSVEVNAGGATPLLDTASNALGGVVNSARVENLPLNGRNFLQLGHLVGGSQAPTGGSNMVASQTGRSDLTISVTGSNQFQTTYLINGIATRGSRIGDSSLNLSVAAIDQFKIELGFFMPDQGPNSGIIDVLTKSGTNQFHGEAYEFVRNTDMDALNYFSPLPDNLHRNQFGFSLGGPVLIPKVMNGRNRLWFFANYEGVRQVSNSAAHGYTPTAAMLKGDFSAEAATMPIYNPFTYDPNTGRRQQFQSNIIPSNLINPVAQKFLAYYLPGSSLAEKPSNLIRYPRDTQNDNQFTIRTDASLTPSQTLAITFSHEGSSVVNASLMPLAGFSFPLDSSLAAVQDTLTMGPHMVNIARIGFDRAAVSRQSEAESSTDLATKLGIAGVTDPNGIPSVGLEGFTGFGNSSGPVGNVDDSYQFEDSFNWMKGTHNIAFGAGIIYHRTKQNNANANGVGGMKFDPVFSAQLTPGSHGPTPAAGTGSSVADFLLGMPTSGVVTGFPAMHYRYTEYFPYFQDSWRLTPHLTVNYGISWYYSSIPNPQGPDAKIPHDFNFTTGLLEYAALGQVDPKVIHSDFNDFTPRLGFAWQPKFSKNTVVRAGAGAYYSQQGMIEGQFAAVAPPFSSPTSFLNDQFTPMPTFTMGNSDPTKNVFPVVPLPPFNDSFAENLPDGTSPFAVNPHKKTPYLWQWTLSLQHTFGADDLVEADYIGNSAHDQQNRYNADQCAVSADLFCDTNNLPYPRYGFVLYSDNNGNLSYNALILKYKHEFTHGLTFLADYTYSKTLSDSWETATATVTQISSCRSCDKGPTSYDIPQRLVVSSVYELPFGRGRTFGSNMPLGWDLVLGGWRWSTIASFQDGNALTVTAPNKTGSPFTLVRADRVCDGRDSHLQNNLRSNGFQWFNTSCFPAPAPGFFGTSARGAIFGPGAQNWDMSFAKQFPIHENVNLEFRGSFFNIFNHTNFGNPNTNSGAGTFGLIGSSQAPRIVQLAGRLVW